MPIWLLLLMPYMWLYVIPANFVIDLVVLAITMKILKVSDLWNNIKKAVIKIWLWGFVSDFIGCLPMLLMWWLQIDDANGVLGRIQYGVMFNPLANVEAFIYVLICVVIAGCFVFYFNYVVALAKTNLSKKEKRTVSLVMAIVTAPYLFFVPTALFVT